MKILAIKSSEERLYIQIPRAKDFSRLLTTICLQLGVSQPYRLESELRNSSDGEHYSEITERGTSIQVILSKSRVHIIIKSPKMSRKRKALLKSIETL